MNPELSREQTLQGYIQAADKDIAYCQSELANLNEMIGHPVNGGYAAKEIEKTKNIIASHQARREKYLQELSSITAKASAVEATELTEVEIAEANLATAKTNLQNILAENEKLLEEYTATLGNQPGIYRQTNLKRRELDRLADEPRKIMLKCEEQLEKAKNRAHAAKFTGTKFEKCTRCAGSGSTIHTHVKYGVCFKCDGTGKQRTRAFNQHMQEIEPEKDDLPY